MGGFFESRVFRLSIRFHLHFARESRVFRLSALETRNPLLLRASRVAFSDSQLVLVAISRMRVGYTDSQLEKPDIPRRNQAERS